MTKILIVEDAAFMRLVLRQILERAGYQVVSAIDGQEGLEQITAEKPDLVIMDMNMPRMNGLEALRAIRSDPAICSLPVLMASATLEDANIAEWQEAGATGYVTKPFQSEQLLVIIQQHLGGGNAGGRGGEG